MSRFAGVVALSLAGVSGVAAHDLGTTPVTWNRQVVRIVHERCASCHRPGGTAFSLLTHAETRAWGPAIKDAVLSRRMPPWGAVKGFGDFRDDQGLTQEQIELMGAWVEGGMEIGDNPNDLPPPPTFAKSARFRTPKKGIRVSGELKLERRVTLAGLFPERVPEGSTMKVVGALPDGGIEPLLWLYEYKDSYRHPFLYRRPLELPAGTVIRGVPREARLVLITASPP